MRLPEWTRHLPHPTYGHYGGAKARCDSHKNAMCPMPIDGMDWLFHKHDYDLRIANIIEDDGQKNLVRERADTGLALSLRAYKGPYARKIWGPVYRRLAMFIFRP
jgi:hypothetical protein